MSTERKYLPTLSELVDRLTITQLKEVFITDHKKEYSEEISDILHDIDVLLKDKDVVVDARAMPASLPLSSNVVVVVVLLLGLGLFLALNSLKLLLFVEPPGLPLRDPPFPPDGLLLVLRLGGGIMLSLLVFLLYQYLRCWQVEIDLLAIKFLHPVVLLVQ